MGQGAPPPPAPENHKDMGILRSTGPDQMENHRATASIHCWVIIGPPAKRHLDGFSLAGRS